MVSISKAGKIPAEVLDLKERFMRCSLRSNSLSFKIRQDSTLKFKLSDEVRSPGECPVI